ncbi:MAG: BrxA/BrxB family bacilliredoxin, partial [Armatimonadetes bacterium]|nr:BrxA/BrxB family bacilliredoxin [Armatimonadota bacterium]
GVVGSLQSETRPERLVTVFAGQDREATERARDYLPGLPPSSPSVALLKDGEVAFMLPRQEIEGRTADQIATILRTAYAQHL